VNAFFAAAREGNFAALVAVLDPDVVLQADGGAARPEAEAQRLWRRRRYFSRSCHLSYGPYS
jgi:hypothetical protein